MTIKPVEAHCDAGCNKAFTITKLRNKKMIDDIQKTFFTCPHCKHEYVSYYTNAESLKLQREMRKLHKTIGNSQTPEELNSLEIQEKLLQIRIKASMDAARVIAEHA